MRGSVFKRCPHGVTGGGGERPPACRVSHGSWYYVTDHEAPPGQRRRQEKRGGYATKADAETALAERLSHTTAGGAHDDRQTLATWLGTWMTTKAGTRKVTTVSGYRRHVDHWIVPTIGHVRLRDLRVGHAEQLLTAYAATPTRYKQRPRSAADVQRLRATLRSALNAARRRRLIAHNVAAEVELPTGRAPKVRPWEPAELGQFLDHAVGDRLGPLFELVAALGLRRGEALGLRWSDLDLERGLLLIGQELVHFSRRGWRPPPCESCGKVHLGRVILPAKTELSERIPLDVDSITVGVLLAHQLEQTAERDHWGEAYSDHDLVFAEPAGGPLYPPGVTRRFNELSDECRLRRVKLKDLRHGAASLRLATGADIAIVSKTLRHSSVRITSDTYSHLLEGVGRQATERAIAAVPRAPRDQPVTSPQVGGNEH